MGYLNSAKIMMVQSMAIIHYQKGATVENVKMVSIVQKLEQNLLRDKVESKLALFSKSLELAQGQGRISMLEAKVELLKKRLKSAKEARNKFKEIETCIVLLKEENEKIQKSASKRKTENIKLTKANLEGYMEGFKKVMHQFVQFALTLDVYVFNFDDNFYQKHAISLTLRCITIETCILFTFFYRNDVLFFLSSNFILKKGFGQNFRNSV